MNTQNIRVTLVYKFHHSEHPMKQVSECASIESAEKTIAQRPVGTILEFGRGQVLADVVAHFYEVVEVA